MFSFSFYLKKGKDTKDGYKRAPRTFFDDRKIKLPKPYGIYAKYGYEDTVEFEFAVSDRLIEKLSGDPEIRTILKDLNDKAKYLKVGLAVIKTANSDRQGFLAYSEKDLGVLCCDEKQMLPLSAQIKKDMVLDKSIRIANKDTYDSLAKKGKHIYISYLSLVFPPYIVNAFEHIMLYTYACHLTGKKIEEPESITFDIDTEKMTVTLTDLHLLEPDAKTLSALFRQRYSGGVNLISSSKADDTNFYDRISGVSGWKKYDKKTFKTYVPNVPGVYMLFDSVNKLLYAGKANDLQTRILQHKSNQNGKDPIPHFDYYRFSLLNDNWYKQLFLVENSAIHDLAMLFNMKNGTTYNGKALNNLFTDIKLGDITLVNTSETQTKENK